MIFKYHGFSYSASKTSKRVLVLFPCPQRFFVIVILASIGTLHQDLAVLALLKDFTRQIGIVFV
jgi:hypothetical protein